MKRVIHFSVMLLAILGTSCSSLREADFPHGPRMSVSFAEGVTLTDAAGAFLPRVCGWRRLLREPEIRDFMDKTTIAPTELDDVTPLEGINVILSQHGLVAEIYMKDFLKVTRKASNKVTQGIGEELAEPK